MVAQSASWLPESVSTRAQAASGCRAAGFDRLCSYEEYCPYGTAEPTAGGIVLPGNRWAPLHGGPSGEEVWVQVGSWNAAQTTPENTCFTFQTLHNGTEPPTKMRNGTALCCHDPAPPPAPIWLQFGQRLTSWYQAIYHCGHLGMWPCDKNIACPWGPGKSPLGGTREGADEWSPVPDEPNSWVLVGTPVGDERSCEARIFTQRPPGTHGHLSCCPWPSQTTTMSEATIPRTTTAAHYSGLSTSTATTTQSVRLIGSTPVSHVTNVDLMHRGCNVTKLNLDSPGLLPNGQTCAARCSEKDVPIGNYTCMAGMLMGTSRCIDRGLIGSMDTQEVQSVGSLSRVSLRLAGAVEVAGARLEAFLSQGVKAALNVTDVHLTGVQGQQEQLTVTGRRLQLDTKVVDMGISATVPERGTGLEVLDRLNDMAFVGSPARMTFEETLRSQSGIEVSSVQHLVAPQLFVNTVVVETNQAGGSSGATNSPNWLLLGLLCAGGLAVMFVLWRLLARLSITSNGEELEGPEPKSMAMVPKPQTAWKDVRAQQLRERIQEEHDKELYALKKLERVNAFWGQEAELLEAVIMDYEKDASAIQEQLDRLETPPVIDHTPPGPASLAFIESSPFACLAMVVIMSNIVTMLLVTQHRDMARKLNWLDNLFLAFYVFELVTKWMYWQFYFLIGHFHKVSWNWLDLIIVVLGVVDQWVIPEFSHGGAGYMSYLRILRVARIARVFRIFKVILRSDLSWTEGENFQSFIMGVICFNAILIGLEADLGGLGIWVYVEQVLLVIFSFELAARIKSEGFNFFIRDIMWNWLDLIIVLGGVVDQWMMPFVHMVMAMLDMKHEQPGNMGQLMMILRMARLLRILRLARLVKNITPLYILVIGIAKAMQGMGWVMVLTSIVLYVNALIGVKLVGHGLAMPPDTPPEVSESFSTVFTAMFSLFLVMNADLSAVQSLIDFAPKSKYCFMLYLMVANWALFSILTAVVSDNMLKASTETENEDRQAEEMEEKKKKLFSLGELFDKLDHDNSGTIESEDFERFLEEGRDQELLDNAHIDKHDLLELSHLLAEPTPEGLTAVIKRADFIKNFEVEAAPLSTRSIMRFTKRIDTLKDKMEKRIQALEKVIRENKAHLRKRAKK